MPGHAGHLSPLLGRRRRHRAPTFSGDRAEWVLQFGHTNAALLALAVGPHHPNRRSPPLQALVAPPPAGAPAAGEPAPPLRLLGGRRGSGARATPRRSRAG